MTVHRSSGVNRQVRTFRQIRRFNRLSEQIKSTIMASLTSKLGQSASASRRASATRPVGRAILIIRAQHPTGDTEAPALVSGSVQRVRPLWVCLEFEGSLFNVNFPLLQSCCSSQTPPGVLLS